MEITSSKKPGGGLPADTRDSKAPQSCGGQGVDLVSRGIGNLKETLWLSRFLDYMRSLLCSQWFNSSPSKLSHLYLTKIIKVTIFHQSKPWRRMRWRSDIWLGCLLFHRMFGSGAAFGFIGGVPRVLRSALPLFCSSLAETHRDFRLSPCSGPRVALGMPLVVILIMQICHWCAQAQTG